eukprot:7222607-Lingulodinium_polyedra.AAC.1
MDATRAFHCTARVAGEAARASSRATRSASFSRVLFQSPSRRRGQPGSEVPPAGCHHCDPERGVAHGSAPCV